MRGNPVDPEHIKEMARLYIDNNMSIREVAAIFNIPYGTAHRNLKKELESQGKTLRPQGGGHNKGKTLEPRF